MRRSLSRFSAVSVVGHTTTARPIKKAESQYGIVPDTSIGAYALKGGSDNSKIPVTKIDMIVRQVIYSLGTTAAGEHGQGHGYMTTNNRL